LTRKKKHINLSLVFLPEYSRKGKKIFIGGGLGHGGERVVMKDSIGKNIVLREYDKSVVFT